MMYKIKIIVNSFHLQMKHVVCAVEEEYCVAAADVEGERVVHLEAFAAEVLGEARAWEHRWRPDHHPLGFCVDGCDRIESPGLGDEMKSACIWITLDFVGLVSAVRAAAHRVGDRGLATRAAMHDGGCQRKKYCEEGKWSNHHCSSSSNMWCTI